MTAEYLPAFIYRELLQALIQEKTGQFNGSSLILGDVAYQGELLGGEGLFGDSHGDSGILGRLIGGIRPGFTLSGQQPVGRDSLFSAHLFQHIERGALAIIFISIDSLAAHAQHLTELFLGDPARSANLPETLTELPCKTVHFTVYLTDML